MAFTLHRLRQLTADQLLMRQFRLNWKQRLGMIVAGTVVASQVLDPIISSVYYFGTQRAWGFRDPGGNWNTYWWLKDAWDRLPVHIENLLGAHWFAGQRAPEWWVGYRHDLRHVLIGFGVTLLVGALTVGLKNRKRASGLHMALSVPLALFTAMALAVPLVVAFSHIGQIGLVTSNTWLYDWLGKASLQATIVGVIAGFPAKRILARTMDTIQLIALENKLAEHAEVKWWWHLRYLPNFIQRYRFLQTEGHVPEAHGKIMGFLLILSVPVALFLLGNGIWLLHFGPAVGALH